MKIFSLQNPSSRITAIDLLRGVASFMVAFYHITCGNKIFFPEGYWMRQLGHNAWSGVEIFFIISGFIIPYSMYKAKYSYNQWGLFLTKRIIRIDPPYIISIFLILGLNYLSTLSKLYHGQPFLIDYRNLIMHIGYLCGILHSTWINPVYWTLSIEFQFYILLACLLPLLINSNKKLVLFILFFLFLSTFIPVQSDLYITQYILYFLIGILCFLRYIKHIKKTEFYFAITLLMCTVFFVGSLVTLSVSLATFILIHFFINIQNKVLLFLGTISYSLYLVHIPIGGRIINLSLNYHLSLFNKTLVAIFALALSVIAAYFFYILIELPFTRLSSNFAKRNRKMTE